MFCPHCNAYLEKKSKFCPNCGGDLSNVQFEPDVDTKQNVSSLSSKKSVKKYYIAGGLIFVLFLFLLYGSNSTSKKDSIFHTETPPIHVDETKAKTNPPADTLINVSLNESFSQPVIAELTVNNTEFTDKVVPTNPASFYTYYKADDGKVYFVANGILKNLKKEKEDMDKLVSVEAVYGDGYKYHCMLLRDRRGDLDGMYEYIDPLQPENVKIAVQLPAEAATNNKPLKLVFNLSTKKYVLVIR